MARGIRSLPTFVYGLVMLNLGVAIVVAEASPLGLAQTGSVAALAVGAGALVAIIASSGTAGDASPPDGGG